MHLFSSKTILELYKTCNVNGEMVQKGLKIQFQWSKHRSTHSNITPGRYTHNNNDCDVTHSSSTHCRSCQSMFSNRTSLTTALGATSTIVAAFTATTLPANLQEQSYRSSFCFIGMRISFKIQIS